MTGAAQARVAHVQALIAAEPTRPHDAIGIVGELHRLCGAAARSLAASGAGVSVMTEQGVRSVAAASDEACGLIDELQFTLGEGPCIDAFASRSPVLEADLAERGAERWPIYTPAAHEHGVRAAFAFPLQIGAARLGVLDVYRRQPGSLTADEVTTALTFADAATTMLLDGQEKAPPGTAAAGLDEALDYHVELYQAQGMVMVQLGISLAQALAVLRAHCFSHDRHLAEVAKDIVGRRLQLEPLP